jgi:hypothetical protein
MGYSMCGDRMEIYRTLSAATSCWYFQAEFVKTHFQAVLVANTAFFEYKYIKSKLIYPTQLQQSHISNHSINYVTPTTLQYYW